MFNEDEFMKVLLMLMEDDDILLTILNKTRRNIIYNNSWYNTSLPRYDGIQFRMSFRMNKNCLNFITEKFYLEAGIVDT